jgi:hypothetical protein
MIAKRIGQQFLGAMFNEGKAAGRERAEIVEIEVIDVDLETLGGKRQHQWNANMPSAADDGQIRGLGAGVAGDTRENSDGQGFSPYVKTKARNGFMKPGANTTRSIAL